MQRRRRSILLSQSQRYLSDDLDLLAMLTLVEGAARAQPYIGMGVCLYHLDYY